MPSRASVVPKALAQASAEQVTAASEDLAKECRECRVKEALGPAQWVAKADLAEDLIAAAKEVTAAVKADMVACRMACKRQVRVKDKLKARVRAATAVNKEAMVASLGTAAAAAATKVVDTANSQVSSMCNVVLPISVTKFVIEKSALSSCILR